MIFGIIADTSKSAVRIVLAVVLASIILQALGVSPLVVVEGQTSDSDTADSDKIAEYTEGSWEELGIHESHIQNGNLELPTTNRTNTVEFQSEEVSNNADQYTVFIDFNQEWPNNTQVDSYLVDENLHRNSDASVSKTEEEELDRYVFSDSEYFADGTHGKVEFRFSINYSVHSNIDSISIYEGDVAMSEYEDSRDNTADESSTEDSSTGETDEKADSEESSTTPSEPEDDVTEGLAAVLDSIFYPNTTSVSNVVIINHIFSLLIS